MGISLWAYCAAFGAGVLLALRDSKASAGVRMSHRSGSSDAPHSRMLGLVCYGVAGGAAYGLAGGSVAWYLVLLLIATSPEPLMPVLHNLRLRGPST